MINPKNNSKDYTLRQNFLIIKSDKSNCFLVQVGMKTKQTNKLRKKDHKELPPTQSLASRSATTLNSRGITKKETLQSRCMKSRILRIMSIYIFMLTRHLDNNTGKIHTPRGSPWKPHQPPPNRVSNNTPNPLIPTPVYINLHTHI